MHAGGWRRAHVEQSLRRAGLPASIGREVYARLGAHALALLLGRGPHVHLSARLAHAIAARRGPSVVWASHTAHWEAALTAVAAHLPLTAIVKRQSQGWAERLVRRRRLGAGTDLQLLHPEGSLQRACAAIAVGRTVVALGDQAPTDPRAAEADHFLGQPCWTDKTPALLAAVTGRPLWVVAQSLDVASGDVLVDLLGSFAPQSPRRAWVSETTGRATALLDAHVRAHPADWLWLHRRWKAPRDAELDAQAEA